MEAIDGDRQALNEARQVLQRLVDEAVAAKSDAYLMVEDNYHLLELASCARDSFGADGSSRSQMKNLEGVALSAHAFSDIVAFVKSQTGRSTRAGDQWRAGGFGRRLHDVLWTTIRNDGERRAEDVFKALPARLRQVLVREGQYDPSELKRELRLRLARAYIRHLVAQYAFLISGV